MYLGYFGLERDPFTISPDPAFLYPSPQHRQALAHLKYGLDREGGFVLLTGEVGTGKTTLTRLLLEQLPGNVRVAYILNARLNALDLLRSICHELELPQTADASVKALTDTLNRDLLATHAAGKKTLLIIEEAQNLDPDVLETLRLLTNLETNTTKLLHILLVGQPELLDLLARTELRQLNQRVVSRFHLDPLSLSETGHYLAHRLRRAGCNRALFDADTVRALYTRAAGIPRMLNLLAERTLLGTYASNAPRPTPKIARTAAREVLGTPPPRRPAPSSKAAEQTTPPDSPHRGPHRGPYPDLANTSKPPPPANRRPTLWLTGLLCTALLGSGTYAALNWPPNW
ncbi:MAG: AAA family ATPase, partial [Cellvibrionales bacterium]|nr:AAA family ATPase [Cellvibrionales bacterium]